MSIPDGWEQSIINATVEEQLAAISNWHDSENPSRMALGAVASCALNYVNILRDQIVKLQHTIMDMRHELTMSERRLKAVQDMHTPGKGRLVHGAEIKLKDRTSHLFVVNDATCKLCGLPIEHPTHGGGTSRFGIKPSRGPPRHYKQTGLGDQHPAITQPPTERGGEHD